MTPCGYPLTLLDYSILGIYIYIIIYGYIHTLREHLVWMGFYGILILVDYLTPNPLYTYYIWFVNTKFVDNIFRLAKAQFFAYS